MVAQTDLILDFVNTLDLRPRSERLATPADLAAWLVERGLLPAGEKVSAGDLAHAKTVREAIRQLLLVHNDCQAEEGESLVVLDAAAARARLCLRFRDGTAHLEPSAPGVAGAVGRILASVADAMGDDTWERLKACRADDCQWGYLDTARNHSRAWCSMSSCGNRAKVNAFRERHGSPT